MRSFCSAALLCNSESFQLYYVAQWTRSICLIVRQQMLVVLLPLFSVVEKLKAADADIQTSDFDLTPRCI